MDILNYIGNVGFPAVLCILMFYYIYENNKNNAKYFEEDKSRYENLTRHALDVIEKSTKVTEELIHTIKESEVINRGEKVN
ncbi:MAG: hypothetical protein NC311_10710 [Muribaculaceae bacterium]|nr:hypothetical protein [Muribaculaceae bacterium]MCM1511426.1 hypothetical protein [Clostridium sp.]